MRGLLLLAGMFLAACQAVGSLTPPPTFTAQAPSTLTPTIVEPTATTGPTSTPQQIPGGEYTVRLHPDGPLFIGDRVSIEVISPGEDELQEKNVQIRIEGPVSADLGSSAFTEFGIGGRVQATFNWVWDTSNLEPGEHQIQFAVQPEGPEWVETVYLHPAKDVPSPEPVAKWEKVQLDCCKVHYITGTDFANDLPDLMEIIQRQADDSVQRMGVEFEQRVIITILPRVLGHGGFAGNEIYISYTDDNYAGNDLSQVLHHEMIHILDRQSGGELRPSLFVEGLAVYLSDGHFKQEPILARVSALYDLDQYLPLRELADSFYTSQHEIGYLEGAALVQFMVNRYGWQAFDDFYRDIYPHPSEKQSLAIDQALQKHFDLTFEQLESNFVNEIQKQKINPDMSEDVILSVTYYDAVRRYQRLLDPSAYFLTAWLPDGEQMRQRGIVADYLRRPSSPENQMIEELLVDIDQQIRQGNYGEAAKELWLVENKLNQVEVEVLIGAALPGGVQQQIRFFD